MPHMKKRVIQLPEEVLENQTCTVCKKYLSYPPTKTYSTGEIKCGRCSKDNDFGVVSSYDILATNIMFPCINRYEGCHEMLEYGNVPEHEKECKGGQYACPICPIGKYRPESMLHLLDHFKKQHKHYVINNLVVHITKRLLSRQYYLHYNPQLNVVILVFLRLDGNVLSTNLSTVGENSNVMQQQVKLFENYPETIISTSSWRVCSSWNDNLESFDISLIDESFSVEFLFKNSIMPVNWTQCSCSATPTGEIGKPGTTNNTRTENNDVIIPTMSKEIHEPEKINNSKTENNDVIKPPMPNEIHEPEKLNNSRMENNDVIKPPMLNEIHEPEKINNSRTEDNDVLKPPSPKEQEKKNNPSIDVTRLQLENPLRYRPPQVRELLEGIAIRNEPNVVPRIQPENNIRHPPPQVRDLLGRFAIRNVPNVVPRIQHENNIRHRPPHVRDLLGRIAIRNTPNVVPRIQHENNIRHRPPQSSTTDVFKGLLPRRLGNHPLGVPCRGGRGRRRGWHHPMHHPL